MKSDAPNRKTETARNAVLSSGKWSAGSQQREVSCELTIIRAELWAKVYAASVAAPANSAAHQMPREMADSAVREFDERFKNKKAANAGTQRPGLPDGSLATETRKPGSLK